MNEEDKHCNSVTVNDVSRLTSLSQEAELYLEEHRCYPSDCRHLKLGMLLAASIGCNNKLNENKYEQEPKQ